MGKWTSSRAEQTFSPKSASAPILLWKTGVVLMVLLATLPLPAAREKDAIQYGMGLIVNVPFPESEVAQVVQDVVQNGIIRGTKEYNKDEYVEGAQTVGSTRVFKQWTEGGKVFYKVRLKAIDPRNFKDGSDVGTLAVRYVVQPQGDKNTVLQINAVFVEDYRKVSHASNGSVEAAEYKDIHDRLDTVQVMKVQTADALQAKQEYEANKHPSAATNQPSSSSSSSSSSSVQPIPSPVAANEPPPDSRPQTQSPPQTLDEHVRDLRQQVERKVKSPGAAMKSAPFHTASTLQSLPTGTEIVIVISTTYWVGVETHDGQHGWILRDDLEQLP